MIKRLLLTLAMVTLGAAAATAAPLNAKVTAIDKDTVQVVVEGKLPDWVKKGGKVRFLSAKGMIVSVQADTVAIATAKASQTKVGNAVTLDKPRAGVSGC